LATALALSLLVGGCAPGTDGIRQGCANADATLSATYQTSTAIYRADQKALRDKLTADNINQVQQTAAAHDAAFAKLIATLDVVRATKTVVCAAADAIDAGLRKLVADVIAQVAQLVADVALAAAQFRKALDEFDVTATSSLLRFGPGVTLNLDPGFTNVPGIPSGSNVIWTVR
jgi:hypothetical protein